MVARLISLALLTLIALGCEGGGSDPAAGSCRASVDDLLGDAGRDAGCHIPLGLIGNHELSPDSVARCAAATLGLEPPPEPVVIEGEAYAVAYAAMCDVHGNTAADFCDISEQLGCDG